jgi:hypothetical protein
VGFTHPLAMGLVARVLLLKIHFRVLKSLG